MRIKRSSGSNVCECDMTPMIDMVFQLIIFFMLVMNIEQGRRTNGSSFRPIRWRHRARNSRRVKWWSTLASTASRMGPRSGSLW